MNWEAIGAIGEVVGAAGVIASLIYLAAQIRQNTRSVEAAAYQSVAEGLADAAFRLVGRGSSDPGDGLLLFVGTIRRYENLYFQVRRGHLRTEDVEGFITSLVAVLRPGGTLFGGTDDIWPLASSMFHPEFVAFVESEVLPRGPEYDTPSWRAFFDRQAEPTGDT
jgi:hypothetical protein